MIRSEADSIGPCAVPAAALFGVRTQRNVDNMSFSGRVLREYPAYVRALCLIKKAAALANHHCGRIDLGRRDAIIAAADELVAGQWWDYLIADVYAGGGSIAINTNINEVIANRANQLLGHELGSYEPVHPKTHVNASQSTADACHSALNIAIVFLWKELDAELLRLLEVSWQKAVEFQDVTVIARTCMQDAMAACLGDSFDAIGSMVKRRREELAMAAQRLKKLNMGGTVIGSGEGAPEGYRHAIMNMLRHVTKIDVALAENLFDAAQNIDSLAAVSANLSLLAGSLIKMAKDLRLMASGPTAGFGEIVLPAVQEGSSFFQGKVNPVVPETLIQACFLVLGLDRTVHAALEHGELNLNVFEGAAGFAVMEALMHLTRSIAKFTERCFTGIRANTKRTALYEETLARLKQQS